MSHLQSLGVPTNKSITDTGHSQDNTCPSGIAIAEDEERSSRRPYVDHTYHDFSHYFQEGGKTIKHKKADANFPAKLHQMLAETQFAHIITWMVSSTQMSCYVINSYFYRKIRSVDYWVFAHLNCTVFSKMLHSYSHMDAPSRF